MSEWLLDFEDARVASPTWEQVERALAALDGRRRTLVCLESGRGDTLMAGGGDDGWYFVDYLLDVDTQEDYVLVDPSCRGKPRELTIGGQTFGPYPAWACVRRPLMLEAARAFFETGTVPDHLTWTRLGYPESAESFEPSRRVQPPVRRTQE